MLSVDCGPWTHDEISVNLSIYIGYSWKGCMRACHSNYLSCENSLACSMKFLYLGRLFSGATIFSDVVPRVTYRGACRAPLLGVEIGDANIASSIGFEGGSSRFPFNKSKL
ncbi:hypothetical protein GOP47_0016015 [Adiantum capillus-veneris]|uniref:Uncharacterized protein n=1 Tax=Adiantum capillus-veneris TaxID=13818 RepID=A0A9D4ZC53_ADICA|nr:hypothetical protein GOP47_0016015 [Adiantum capillus-veneris]